MAGNKFLQLRNEIHEGKFRFDVTQDLWKRHYMPGETAKPNRVLTITENGKLMGYVVYSIAYLGRTEVCRILDICAKEEKDFRELVSQVIGDCLKENVDFIYLRQCNEIYEGLLDEMGFFPLEQSVIMVVLLDPHELLLSLSEEIDSGKILRLTLEGFQPITIRVGKGAIRVLDTGHPDLAITTDSRTFLKLLFGRTRFWKELLRRKVAICNLLHLRTAIHFFSLIRVEKWYIPQGDWL